MTRHTPTAIAMTHPAIIRCPRQLDEFCERLARVNRLGLDTEFVSEDTYRPQLCLVQVATACELAVIDAIEVGDLTPFWRLLVDHGRETVVHAGREELGFCLTALGRQPAKVFDTQIAAGLVATEYPAGYGSLVWKYLGETASKGETRTEWRRRPLSDAQVIYAIEDVRHLLPLRDKLAALLEERGRADWLTAETAAWQDDVEAARSRRRWRSVPGVAGLSSRSLAIFQELWLWRDGQARARDIPPRRVLRDDLIVEIARRKIADPSRIRAVRGLDRKVLNRVLPELAACVRRGLEQPADELPRKTHEPTPGQANILGQFLACVLNGICRNAQIAPGLVGTVSDVRELVAYRLGLPGSDGQCVPSLAQGWRTTVVGNVLDDLLAGKTCIRIKEPTSEQPLAFEPAAGGNVDREDALR